MSPAERDEQLLRDAALEVASLALRWQRRAGRGPTRAHHFAVEIARSEAAVRDGLRAVSQ